MNCGHLTELNSQYFLRWHWYSAPSREEDRELYTKENGNEKRNSSLYLGLNTFDNHYNSEIGCTVLCFSDYYKLGRTVKALYLIAISNAFRLAFLLGSFITVN